MQDYGPRQKYLSGLRGAHPEHVTTDATSGNIGLMEEERTSSGLVGWLAAFILTAVVAGGIVFFMDLGPKKKEPKLPTATSALSPPPQAMDPSEAPQPENLPETTPQGQEPPPEGVGINQGAAMLSVPSGQKDTGTQPVPDVVSGVAGLGDVVGAPAESEMAASLLEKSTFCRKGRTARRAPSLFGARGFAITYGSDTFANGGDPFPRLEIFVNETGGQRFASILSLTPDPVPGFPNNQETAMPWDDGILRTLIARWVEGAADGTCPVRQ